MRSLVDWSQELKQDSCDKEPVTEQVFLLRALSSPLVCVPVLHSAAIL